MTDQEDIAVRWLLVLRRIPSDHPDRAALLGADAVTDEHLPAVLDQLEQRWPA